MAQVQECTTSKPPARLKVIVLVAIDDATLSPLAHVLSQKLHFHIFVASSGFAAVKFVKHITPHLLIVDNCRSVKSIVSGGQNDVLYLWMQKALRYDG